MNAETWLRRYAAALAAGERLGAPGPDGPWPLALGFTNSIDRIVTLDAAKLTALIAAHQVADAATSHRVDSPRAFVASVLGHVREGSGGELWLRDPGLTPWLRAQFTGRAQVGGTGARGANTVAGLGFGSILHTTSLPPAQATLIDDSGAVMIPTRYGLRRPSQAARRRDPEMVHYIFEYQAGLTVNLGGERLIAPQANRLIVSLDPANFRHPIDPLYIAAVADPRHAVRWVLASGFSQVTTTAMAAARIAETISAINRWRHRTCPPRIHLELGAMPDPAIMDLVLTRLAPAVDSVGLNADELRTILASPRATALSDPGATVEGMQALRRRLGVGRLSLHTQDYCLTLTTGDPAAERAALLYGSLVAGTFARRATFPTRAYLAATLASASVSPAGLVAGAALAARPGHAEDRGPIGAATLVFTPTLAVTHPRTTIGLGDSFTAGMLALL